MFGQLLGSLVNETSLYNNISRIFMIGVWSTVHNSAEACNIQFSSAPSFWVLQQLGMRVINGDNAHRNIKHWYFSPSFYNNFTAYWTVFLSVYGLNYDCVVVEVVVVKSLTAFPPSRYVLCVLQTNSSVVHIPKNFKRRTFEYNWSPASLSIKDRSKLILLFPSSLGCGLKLACSPRGCSDRPRDIFVYSHWVEFKGYHFPEGCHCYGGLECRADCHMVW